MKKQAKRNKFCIFNDKIKRAEIYSPKHFNQGLSDNFYLKYACMLHLCMYVMEK